MSEELRGRFLGIRQQHSYNQYHLFDQVITKYNPQSFIEIGTGHGAMSIFLGLYAHQRAAPMITIDMQHKGDLDLALPFFDLLGIVMYQGDCFEMLDRIRTEIAGKRVFFLCDGGNKIKEFSTFKPFLGKGSILTAHDFPYEINTAQVDTNGLCPIEQHRWEETKTMLWEVI
jgi:predicted O-methyltransferase YrrM